MKRFIIIRSLYAPNGTPGEMLDEYGEHVCYTIERPRLGEHPCIPEGLYRATRYDSPTHGKHIWQLDVPGRTHIQFHIANWPHELLGCIAPGESTANGPNSEPGVSRSGAAYHRFMGRTADDDEIEFSITSEEYQ